MCHVTYLVIHSSPLSVFTVRLCRHAPTALPSFFPSPTLLPRTAPILSTPLFLAGCLMPQDFDLLPPFLQILHFLMELKGSKKSGEEGRGAHRGKQKGGETNRQRKKNLKERRWRLKEINKIKTGGQQSRLHVIPPSFSHLFFFPLSFSGIIKPQCGNISGLAAYWKAVCPR